MKKILLGIALCVTGLVANAQFAILSTNLASGGPILISTNRAAVYSVEISSTTAGTVKLFDQNTTAAPYYGTNFVTAAYPYRISYTTNKLSTYVGANGYTNYVTNVGIFSLSATNSAATNALNPSFAASIGANIAAVHATDAIFNRGIVALCQGVTNGSITIYYRPGQ